MSFIPEKYGHEVSPRHRTIRLQQPLQENKYHVTSIRIIQTNNHDEHNRRE